MSGLTGADEISAADRQRVLRDLTQPARETFLAKFQSEEERAAHFSELGRRSAAARRARAEQGTVTNVAA